MRQIFGEGGMQLRDTVETVEVPSDCPKLTGKFLKDWTTEGMKMRSNVVVGTCAGVMKPHEMDWTCIGCWGLNRR